MSEIKWVNIATKAYQQACKYENVSTEFKEKLFHFVHDWFRQIEDENTCLENNEETPNQMYGRFMSSIKEKTNE